MNAADRLLGRLTGVRQTGTGRWISRCPAHEDDSPSLSIRELDDGRVLLHCFGGCETGDVLAAIGLSMSNLFDKPLAHHLPPVRGGFNPRELLELSAHEALVAALIISDAQGRVLTDDERSRLALATARLTKVEGLANGR